MIGVFVGEVRIGTVEKFAGNKPMKRWVAYSCFGPTYEFALRRQAIAYLDDRYRDKLRRERISEKERDDDAVMFGDDREPAFSKNEPGT